MVYRISAAAFWSLVVCLFAFLMAALRCRLTLVAERRRAAPLEQRLRVQEAEARHLAEVRLPAAAEAAHSRSAPVPGLLDPGLAGSSFGRSVDTVASAFAGFVATAQARADRAARASLASAMKALQGLANEQQLAISAMQSRHDNPDVLQDLLEIDHMNAQIGRRAQAISVLSGSWPGRQRTSSPVLTVIRGATSRIRDYQRVQIRGQADLAVISRAVEPVVLAVAELLDNAARHSPADTPIEVSLRSAHNGVSVVIDDCGVGMLDEEIGRAAALLSGEQAMDVTRLGDPPAFGHAVVGQLASRYGFRAFADSTSPFGGLRAVLFLPSALLIAVDKTVLTVVAHPGSSPRTVTAAPSLAQAHPAAPPSASPAAPPSSAPAPGELPQRRRLPAAEPARAEAPQTSPAPARRPGRPEATALGAFQRGTRDGRAGTPLATTGGTPEGPSDSERQPQR